MEGSVPRSSGADPAKAKIDGLSTMEGGSNRLREMLDWRKFDVPEDLMLDLIKHVNEDDPYEFFRYVQDLLETRRLDNVLRADKELLRLVRDMYAERLPWLLRQNLRYVPEVPGAAERDKSLQDTLKYAWRGQPTFRRPKNDKWITEYLTLNGLNWDDVAQGRHFRVEVPDTGEYQFRDHSTLRLEPDAALMGLSGVVEHDYSSSSGSETPPPDIPRMSPQPDGLLAMWAAAEGRSEGEEGQPENEEGQPALARFLAGDPDYIAAWKPACSADGFGPTPPPDGDIRLPDFTPVPSSPPPAAPAGAAGVAGWLEDWLRNTGAARGADFQPHAYKGWVVASPRVMLVRIINFLCDEDIDSTPDWSRKVAEITEYLAYLLVNYDKDQNSWGYSLHEAIMMLNTHAAYEDYHYGKRPLNLDFDKTPRQSERLPPVSGLSIEFKPQKAFSRIASVPRNLLHRLPMGVWDAQYGVPRLTLRGFYLKELRSDEKLYWATMRPGVARHERPPVDWPDSGRGRAIANSYPFGFNMCEIEDKTFISCMTLGPLRTYQELKASCRFDYEPEKVVSESRSRKNTQLLQFSKFRGANRAALTFALRTLGSQTREIKAVSSPWRRLVVPKPDNAPIPKPWPGIIWKPIALKADDVPKHDLDPMAYNFWHRMLLDSQRSWATAMVKRVEEARETLGRGEYPPAPKTNFKGPFTAIDVSERRYNEEQFLRRLKKTWCDLKIAARWAPRPVMADILENIEFGREGIPLVGEEKGTFLRHVIGKNMPSRAAGAEEEHGILRMKPDDQDLVVLQRIVCVSINAAMRTRVPKEWGVRRRIFADRVQALLADISPASIFAAKETEVLLDEVVAAVNVNTDGPVSRIRFTSQEAEKYLDELEAMQRIHITRHHSDERVEKTYSRPVTDIHPEHTVIWDYDPWMEAPYTFKIPTFIAYNSIEDVQAHTREQSLTYTIPFVKGAAWRLGHTIGFLEDAHARNCPTEEQRARLRDTYRDLTRSWEKEVADQRSSDGERNTMDYRDIIRYAEPSCYDPAWADDDVQHDDAEMLDLVHEGILRESHEDKNMLWPSRWYRTRCPTTGEYTVHWRRDGVWSWASPSVRRGSRYFSLNRWPLHLQEEKWQKKIVESGLAPMPNRVLGGAVKRKIAVSEEERPRARLTQLTAEMESARLKNRTTISLAKLAEDL